MVISSKTITDIAPETEEASSTDAEVATEQSPTFDEVGGSKIGEPKTQMYLLSALTKDAKSALDELTALVAAAGSKIEKAEDLGLRKLHFPINKLSELFLVSVFFKADSQTIRTLDSELKHTETIERYLMSTWRAGLDEPKRRQAERQKREAEKNV